MTDAGGAIDTPVLLRILLANERLDRLDGLAHVITEMGHEVVGRETDRLVA